MTEIIDTSNLEATSLAEVPKKAKASKKTPEYKEQKIDTPTPTIVQKEIPEPKPLDKELPSNINEENSITLNGRVFEIKPTKMKYFRNRTANIYSVLKIISLNEFLSYKKGTFDAERDSDQILFDFLVAVFDDAAAVRDFYDDMTSDDIERILKIFGRLNHIDEKEEQARKNREAQVAKH